MCRYAFTNKYMLSQEQIVILLIFSLRLFISKVIIYRPSPIITQTPPGARESAKNLHFFCTLHCGFAEKVQIWPPGPPRPGPTTAIRTFSAVQNSICKISALFLQPTAQPNPHFFCTLSAKISLLKYSPCPKQIVITLTLEVECLVPFARG